MRNAYQISLNQLAVFPGLTEAGKRRVIAQQLQPDPFRIPWYQLPRGRLKKSIEQNGNLKPIYDGINALMKRKPENRRQETDRKVSIEALERYLSIKLPRLFKEVKFEIIKPGIKSLPISGLEVIVAPDLIVRGQLNGQIVVGAVKFHICKRKPFDLQESKRVASTIFRYLNKVFDKEEMTILPELCCCYDVFSDRIMTARDTDDHVVREVDSICNEIRHYYDVV